MSRMLSIELGEFAASTDITCLPKPTVEAVKLFILDYISSAAGGVGTEVTHSAASGILDSFPGDGSTIIGEPDTSGLASAIYLNARSANALDADDAHLNFLHVGPAMVSPALAIGERAKLPGSDFLVAVAVGYEIGVRLGSSTGMPLVVEADGRFRTAEVYGSSWKTVAASASCANALKLSSSQSAHAIAIAAANAPLPSMSKWRLHDDRPLPMQKTGDVGWMALGGLVAAQVANSGSTGFLDIFEGNDGFWRMISAEKFNPSVLTDGLGDDWAIHDAGLKRYPACHHICAPLDLVRGIREANPWIRADDVRQVTVKVSPMASSKLWANTRPRNSVESQFSIPHCIAMELLGVGRSARWHDNDQLSDGHAQGIRELVSVEVLDGALNALIEQSSDMYRSVPTCVEIELTSGERFSAESENAFGDQWADGYEIGWQEIEEKFRDFADGVEDRPRLTARAIDDVTAMMKELEYLEDLSELTRCLRDLRL